MFNMFLSTYGAYILCAILCAILFGFLMCLLCCPRYRRQLRLIRQEIIARDKIIMNKEEITSRYIDAGVQSEKILDIIEYPAFAWSNTRKKIVNYPESLELVTRPNGSKWLTIENNRFHVMKTYNELSESVIKEINSSEGIVAMITDTNYRFAIIG